MARKASPRKTPKDKLIDAALTLAAEKPWPRVAMTDIAAAAKVPLAEAYDVLPCRADVAAALIARHDKAMLAGDDPSLAEESPRDRLFDVIMRRLEAMRPHKAALKSMAYGAPADVGTLLTAGPRMLSSAQWMLRAAGIGAEGPFGLLRAKAVLCVYAAALRAFDKDDSEDLASTMAALDKALKRAGRAF